MNTTDLRTDRTTLKRHAERGAHDVETIASILDEAMYCHIGFVVDGQPYVVPTGYGRDGQTVYYRLSDHEFLEKLRTSFFAEMEPALLSTLA